MRSFFREGTEGHPYPAGRSELTIAIKQAYDLRSTYIHTLKPLPKNLVSPHIQSDVFADNGKLLLSFRGLARVARHVILEFISQSSKIDKRGVQLHGGLPEPDDHATGTALLDRQARKLYA